MAKDLGTFDLRDAPPSRLLANALRILGTVGGAYLGGPAGAATLNTLLGQVARLFKKKPTSPDFSGGWWGMGPSMMPAEPSTGALPDVSGDYSGGLPDALGVLQSLGVPATSLSRMGGDSTPEGLSPALAALIGPASHTGDPGRRIPPPRVPTPSPPDGTPVPRFPPGGPGRAQPAPAPVTDVSAATARLLGLLLQRMLQQGDLAEAVNRMSVAGLPSYAQGTGGGGTPVPPSPGPEGPPWPRPRPSPWPPPTIPGLSAAWHDQLG